MGNHISGHSNENVFENELKKINSIVNDIISDKDIFKNGSYNFLSQDVCEKYQVVLEDELKKHLKLEIRDLGASIYIIPKNDKEEKLTKYNLTKKEVCDKISNHYIKILYILCLVKYVYNIEKAGDLSIAGIIFRNIKIVDDMMQIYFCGLPHKNYNDPKVDAYKIDFSKLEGMNFFTKYFLTPEESSTFLGILRTVLSRSSSNKVRHRMCHYIDVHGTKDVKELEKMYKSRFPNNKLVCKQGGGGGPVNLNLFIERNNAVFLSDYCGAPLKLNIKLNTPEGRKLMEIYKHMHTTYKSNIDDINKLLSKMVYKKGDQYELNDINKHTLNGIIEDVKIKIKSFYIESIFNFQNLLDFAKKTPNIHIN